MSDHIQECPVYEGSCCPWMGDCNCQCLCDILSACEKRVNSERKYINDYVRQRGYELGLDAAMNAIESLRNENESS